MPTFGGVRTAEVVKKSEKEGDEAGEGGWTERNNGPPFLGSAFAWVCFSVACLLVLMLMLMLMLLRCSLVQCAVLLHSSGMHQLLFCFVVAQDARLSCIVILESWLLPQSEVTAQTNSPKFRPLPVQCQG